MNRSMRIAPRRRQHGVAAIEFALVFALLFGILYALATLGAVLYTQQAVTRAASEGARAVGMLTPAPTAGDTRVIGAVYDTLAKSLVVPVSSNTNTASRRSWIASNVVVSVTTSPATGSGAAYTRFVVAVTYPYSANRLLPTLPFLDASTWMPDQLRSRASAALKIS